MKPLDLDFAKIIQFEHAIINVIDDNGFPFSFLTDFEITPHREIVLKKPASVPPLKSSRVGVLFNHITAIPTGGYTDRRYIQIWGKLTEDRGRLRLHPEAISEWDEKILPFDQLCARAAPQGQKYLQMLQGQIEA